MKYNTRIAPSPTGDFHLGTLRTAYFNWLVAKSTGGNFILRIDDTDTKRNIPGMDKKLLCSLMDLGINPDLIYKQSDRLYRYNTVAKQLLYKGLAIRDDGCIRFNNVETIIVWQDTIAGTIKVSNNNLDQASNLVLIKSNGFPTYHFASVVDDIDMKINWVIRGKDHIDNTSKQLSIFYNLNKDLPKFTHLGLLKKDNKLLSKRDNASSVNDYLNQGYRPDAILNFLARLGWGPTVDDKSTKILTKSDMLRLFLDGGKMRSSDSNVDMNLLDSYNRKYKARK